MTQYIQFQDNETQYLLMSGVKESTVIKYMKMAIEAEQANDKAALQRAFDSFKSLLQESLSPIQERIFFELLRRAVVVPPSSFPLAVRVARDNEFRCSVRVITEEALGVRGATPKLVCTFKAIPTVYVVSSQRIC
jgi:hypothetical protein